MFKEISHIGIAVYSIEEALKFYRDAIGFEVASIKEVASEGVRVAILPVGGIRLELLEPLHPESSLHGILEKRGEGIHHIAFRTENIQKTVQQLKKSGVRILGEPRPGTDKLQITFLHPKCANGVLIEICGEPQG